MTETPTPKYIIAGGSGFLGLSLANHLAATGAAVVILSRTAPRITGPWRHVPWDARTLADWKNELNGATGLVNLTGRTVDCIKTPDHQDEILRSRVESTLVLGQAMRSIDTPPPVWVQMSTAHIYGDPPTLVCNEDSPFVGRAWEEAYHASVLPSQRQVILRTSFVIGRDSGAGSGALAKLRPLVRFGLGGPIGRGKQGMSWIHEADMNRIFEAALTNSKMQGAYIATAPNPVSQSVFMREMRKALRIPIGLPAFPWMVRLAAPLLLRTDPDLVLYGRYVISKRLPELNFQFKFPELRGALTDLLSKRK